MIRNDVYPKRKELLGVRVLLPILAEIATIGVSNADYPSAALAQRRDGVVGIQYTVGPSGRVSRCRINLTSGWPDLDATTCAAVLKRGRFQPKRDDAGNPVSDTRQLRYRWALPSGPAGSRYPALPTTGEIAVAAFPKDMARPAVNVTFQVGADGKIANCGVNDGDGTGSNALDKVACDSVQAADFPVVRDGIGKPISYTRVMTITFSTNSAQAAHQ